MPVMLCCVVLCVRGHSAPHHHSTGTPIPHKDKHNTHTTRSHLCLSWCVAVCVCWLQCSCAVVHHIIRSLCHRPCPTALLPTPVAPKTPRLRRQHHYHKAPSRTAHNTEELSIPRPVSLSLPGGCPSVWPSVCPSVCVRRCFFNIYGTDGWMDEWMVGVPGLRPRIPPTRAVRSGWMCV